MSPADRPDAPIHGRHGLYDLSRLHVSHHARERFRERAKNALTADQADADMPALMRQCRKLGTNAEGAAAFLAIYADQPIVLIVKGGNVVTCMSLDQFESVMADFGRHRWPRRFGRWLRKTTASEKIPPSEEPLQPE